MAKTILAERKFLIPSGEDVFNTLAVVLFFTFLVGFAQYQWKRWGVYQMIGHRKGPIALPFIGSAWYFMGSSTDYLNKLSGLANKFKSPLPMWIGKRLCVVIWNPEDLEIVMKSPLALNKNRAYKLIEFVVGDGLLTATASKWKQHRKIILPTFHPKILEGYVTIFSQKSEIVSKQLEKVVGKTRHDIFEIISRHSLDVLCETAMGITIDAQSEHCNFFKWTSGLLELAAVGVVQTMSLPNFEVRQSYLWKKGMNFLEKFNSFTDTVIKEKKMAYQEKLKQDSESSRLCFEDEAPKKKVFLQHLLELSEEGTKFTDEELREEVATFLVAGSDTTSTVNCYILVMLGMFPHIQNKVYQEVMSVLGPDRQVESKDLNSFSYLEKVIKETMRLFPPGPLLSRTVTGNIKLGECIIPKRSSVLLNILALHRDPEIWQNPLDFNPDRFLPEEVSKRHPYSYLPFSGGFRSCPGLNFAMMSMKTVLATIVRKYQFYTDYQSIEEIKLKFDILMKPVDGFKISLNRRNANSNNI